MEWCSYCTYDVTSHTFWQANNEKAATFFLIFKLLEFGTHSRGSFSTVFHWRGLVNLPLYMAEVDNVSLGNSGKGLLFFVQVNIATLPFQMIIFVTATLGIHPEGLLSWKKWLPFFVVLHFPQYLVTCSIIHQQSEGAPRNEKEQSNTSAMNSVVLPEQIYKRNPRVEQAKA